MQTINIMSDNKDKIKKENQNKVEENSKDEDRSTKAKENLEDNIEVKLNDLNDKYLRLLAENQNLRKNHEQEKEDILKYGSFSFAQQILGLTDNLDRAFQIFKNDEKFKTDEFKNILSGIEMIEKELQSTLEKNSIRYIDCLDKPFDPNLHQAIGEKESDKSPGTVVEEMQKGYQMHDRLLRPSMVYVSKKSDK
ncbi:nucleotide exchange factor GrpE [Candidatus Pelagibacter sp. HIMB109]|uniref:nucleotide exchange factor GrpE n=1 Tax=Candidatus Pelagibacter sp. HIMB109 TaxID=3415412 RepID=UPI003F870DD6